MMARSKRISGKGGSFLDNGVAALAALSTGFVTYAMPEGLFARLILASHIPDFLAAAQPPLGMKARLAVIAAVALLAYAAVWTLMRALDSVSGASRTASLLPEAAEEAPRLRRADAHPDAPSRRPILAGRDLGEPAFDDEPLELEPESVVGPESGLEVQSAHELEPEPEHSADPLPAFLVPQEPEPAAQPEPEIAEAPAAAPDTVAEPSLEEEYEGAEEESAEEADAAYQTDDDEQSLARLMQRFESGLSRKQQILDAIPPVQEPEPEMPTVPQERVGHRLRSAITDLGKISAPGR